MESKQIDEARILREIEAFSNTKDGNLDTPWGFLPPFADDTNKQLHTSILELEETLGRLDEDIEEHSNYTKILSKHKETVEQDIKYTTAQVLDKSSIMHLSSVEQLNAKKREMETEDHLKKLAERETGRLVSERRKLQQEQNTLDGVIHSLEMNVFSSNEQLNEFKSEMNFNAEELERWVEEREKVEEDKAILEKYKRQDDSLVKSLNAQIQTLDRQTLKTKDELAHEITETQALQVQMEKTAHDFRQLHDERVALLKQWNEAVETLKQRDHHINETNSSLEGQLKIVKEKRQTVNKLEQEIASAENEYRALELQFQAKDRQLSVLKDNLRVECEKNLDIKKDHDLLQVAHHKAQKYLNQKENETNNSKKHLKMLKDALREAHEKLEQTRSQMQEEKSRLEQLELQDTDYQKKLLTEERRLNEADKEMNSFKKEKYKKNQMFQEERRRETELLSSIAGIASQDRNLKSKIQQMDEEIVRQEELLYSINFKVVMMERKVERATGIRSPVETEELHTCISNLTSHLEKVNTQHSVLINQSRRTEHELDQARKRNDRQLEEQERIEMIISETEMDSEMIQKQIKDRQEEKENLMVEEDVLTLQLRKLQDILQSKSSEVSTLESKKQILRSSIREKKDEIALQRDCLKFELKNARDEVHRVKIDLSDRRNRLEKLRLKYETLLSKKESLFDTEPKSQSYYLIRAAQEKEELLQEEQKMEHCIKTAETEVRGLEKALSGILRSNQDYKRSMEHKCDSDLLETRAEFNEELDVAYDQLKYCRAEESSILNDIKEADEHVTSIQQELTQLTETVTRLAEQMAEAEHQLQDQLEKEDRAKNRAKKLLAETKAKEAVADDIIQLSVIQDVNRSILTGLRTSSHLAQCPMAPLVIDEIQSHGIKMPNSQSNHSTPRNTRPNSTQSLRPNSGASNTSLTIKQMHLEL